MIGLDCNILVQLAMADHPANQISLDAVQVEINRGENLGFPPMVGTEFLHIVTDERRFKPPLTMAEATQWLDDFASEPSVNVIVASPASLTLTTAWIAPLGACVAPKPRRQRALPSGRPFTARVGLHAIAPFPQGAEWKVFGSCQNVATAFLGTNPLHQPGSNQRS